MTRYSWASWKRTKYSLKVKKFLTSMRSWIRDMSKSRWCKKSKVCFNRVLMSQTLPFWRILSLKCWARVKTRCQSTRCIRCSPKIRNKWFHLEMIVNQSWKALEESNRFIKTHSMEQQNMTMDQTTIQSKVWWNLIEVVKASCANSLRNLLLAKEERKSSMTIMCHSMIRTRLVLPQKWMSMRAMKAARISAMHLS